MRLLRDSYVAPSAQSMSIRRYKAASDVARSLRDVETTDAISFDGRYDRMYSQSSIGKTSRVLDWNSEKWSLDIEQHWIYLFEACATIVKYPLDVV